MLSDISNNDISNNNDEHQLLLERINRNRQIYESLNYIIENTINEIHEQQSLAQAIDESLRSVNPYKETISEKGLSDIIYIPYNKDIHQNTNCPITLEDLSEEKNVAQLPCKHIADKDEIINWLKEKPECPICRYKMDSIEIKIENTDDDDDDAEYVEAEHDEAEHVDHDDWEDDEEGHIISTTPHQQTLENYPTQSTILNTLLYLNYNSDEQIVEQRNSFMRNLNTLNRLNQ